MTTIWKMNPVEKRMRMRTRCKILRICMSLFILTIIHWKITTHLSPTKLLKGFKVTVCAKSWFEMERSQEQEASYFDPLWENQFSQWQWKIEKARNTLKLRAAFVFRSPIRDNHNELLFEN